MTNPASIQLNEFLIAGISVRTINNGQAGIDIKQLWGRFYDEAVADKINNKLSNDVYCVYTGYTGNHTGYYTCLLGCKVSSAAILPAGITACIVPASDYKIYKSQGNLPHSVIATWETIWATDINRTYKADFDIYTPEAWGSGTVLTYVGVK